MEWRKTNNIDSIPFEKIPEYFNDYFNCHFGGIDKHGRPGMFLLFPAKEYTLEISLSINTTNSSVELSFLSFIDFYLCLQ